MDGMRAITKTSYDARRHKLTVSFASGRDFDFHSIPPAVAAQLAQAKDSTTYFDHCIRGRYAAVEISDGQVLRNSFQTDPFGE
jgi:hypothetical protein